MTQAVRFWIVIQFNRTIVRWINRWCEKEANEYEAFLDNHRIQMDQAEFAAWRREHPYDPDEDPIFS